MRMKNLQKAHHNVDEIHKRNAEQQKTHTKEHMVYDSIYIDNRNNHSESRLLEVRMVVTSGWVGGH